MIKLDYRDYRPIYSQIMDGFREQILAGVLREGEKLPSVRELAAELSINPNTIQRAYRELEAGGWVATVQGKGCFVCAAPARGNMDLLKTFDRTVQALLEAGMTPAELIERLQKGGNSDAETM